MEVEKFLSRMPAVAKGTKTMWRTAKNNLVRLLSSLSTFEGTALTGNHWEKFETLTPTGVWNAFRAQKKASRGKNAQDAASQATTGNSSANHMASFLRRFVPDFVDRGSIPPSLISNAQSIPKLVVHPRDPKIPSPPQMEEFLKECECDWEVGQLLRFLAYSGARKGTVFDRDRAVRWDQVDFEARDIILRQKGDVRRRVPMGRQLCDVLGQWKISRPPDESDPRIFRFGSGREDRALATLKLVAKKLGGSVAEMTMLHSLKHYFKTQHQRQGTPNDVSDFLTFNSPSVRPGSGDIYRHDLYAAARRWAKIATFPIRNDTRDFVGNEYFSIYPRVEAYKDDWIVWIADPPNLRYLKEWLATL
jgi:integrase